MLNGENMSMRGFYIRDASTHRGISHRELFELVPGSVIFKVAGASFRPDALQLPALRRENPSSSFLSRRIDMTAVPLRFGTQQVEYR